ncbi:MAG: c-type cytochrome [Acidobacteriota bacterium]
MTRTTKRNERFEATATLQTESLVDTGSRRAEASLSTSLLALLLAVTFGLPFVAQAQKGDRPGHVMTEVWREMEVPPAPVLSPEDGLASLRLPPGYRAELVAAEPLVEDPVAIQWDERGRLWVVEMRGFMPNVDGIGEDQPVGRIVVLDDTDRDGRMDKGSVFLDELVMPRALAVTSSGILIAEPPHLWLCADVDQDDTCDEKVHVADYADPDLDRVEHTENGLLWGLDNWIYSAKSDRRLRFRKGEVTVEPTAFRGQWGISQDDEGRLYYNTNSRWLYADVHPPEYHYRNTADRPRRIPGVGERIVDSEEVHTVRVNPGINRGYQPDMLREDGRLARTTSVSGLCIYRGHQFPEELRGDIFIPEPAGNVVGFFDLEHGPASITADHFTTADSEWGEREFLASPDERFRPVDCAVGPDGALTVIDMYRGILQHRQYVTTFLRKQILERQLDRPLGLGRIYRIVREDRPIDHSRPRLATMEDRLEALEHANGWHRDTAQRLLVEAEDPASIAPLRKLAQSGARLPRVHALWTLHGLQSAGVSGLDLPLVRTALESPDAPVRQTALRLIDGLSTADRQELEGPLRTMLSADVAEAQRAAFALGDIDSDSARAALVKLLVDVREPVRIAALSGLADYEVDAFEQLVSQRQCSSACLTSAESLLQAALRRHKSGESVHRVFAALTALHQNARSSSDLAKAALQLIESATTLTKEDDWSPLEGETSLVASLRSSPASADLATDVEALFGGTEAAPATFDRVAARRLFRACSTCHDDGRASSGVAPSLEGATLATGPPETLIRVILDGVTGPLQSKADGSLWNEIMPGFRGDRRFNDESLAALVSYIRSSWGNELPPVDAATVSRVRKGTAERSEPWRVDELEVHP